MTLRPPHDVPEPDDALLPGEADEADALRTALEGGDAAHEGASLLTALRAAHAPRPIDQDAHAALVEAALAAAGKQPARRGVVIRVAFGLSALTAAAAALVLGMRGAGDGESGQSLHLARSTQALFAEPFGVGQATARVDRIAAARSGEFRDNQFARWGLR